MPAGAAQKLDSYSFLVVDDEAFIQNLLVQMLRLKGATKVATASSGAEALAHLDSADPQPNVLLIDLLMPDMGGAILMNQLAERGYKGSVILVSGLDQEILAIAGAFGESRGIRLLGTIMKPITPEALGEMLAKLD